MRVAVVGLGKLGMPLAAVFSASGHDVIGIDRSTDVVDSVGEPGLFTEPGLAELMAEAPFEAVTQPYGAAGADFVFLLVPTPSTHEARRFSNRYVLEAIDAVAPFIKPGAILSINSTVMPGTTGGIVTSALRNGSDHSEEIGVAYNPEFIALGDVIKGLTHPDIVLIGSEDPRVRVAMQALWLTVVPDHIPFKLMDTVSAEIAKLALNTYVTMKISFANVIGELCDRMDVNAEVVLDAVGEDQRVGKSYLRPTGAYGGPCFPRDVRAFQALVDDGVLAGLARETERINERQVERMVTTLLETGERDFAILGTAYKPGTPVMDDSPGLAVANALIEAGMQVWIHEPALGHTNPAELIRNAQVVAVLTPDPAFRGIESFTEPRLLFDPWKIISGDQWNRIPWSGAA